MLDTLRGLRKTRVYFRQDLPLLLTFLAVACTSSSPLIPVVSLVKRCSCHSSVLSNPLVNAYGFFGLADAASWVSDGTDTAWLHKLCDSFGCWYSLLFALNSIVYKACHALGSQHSPAHDGDEIISMWQILAGISFTPLGSGKALVAFADSSRCMPGPGCWYMNSCSIQKRTGESQFFFSAKISSALCFQPTNVLEIPEHAAPCMPTTLVPVVQAADPLGVL